MKHLSLTLILVACALHAQAELAPGHSYHGEAFNEGPRQAAHLIEGSGHVHIKVTTDSKKAQQFFDQGLGQLHGFWYFEAERSFRQAAVHDPKCAMNYWGMAMANTKNEKRAIEFIKKAKSLKDSASALEKAFIDSLATFYDEKKRPPKARFGNYAKALKKMTDDFPDHLEPRAFYALQLWTNSRKGHPIKDHEAPNKILESIFKENPKHPSHHYRIHLWDKKDAKRALTSAAAAGPASPAIAHMWHMPGHIYSKLKRYHDAAWQQEASARVDHSHMMRDLLLPDQIHNYAHNNEWLSRNLSQIGRVQDAINLAKNMCDLPRHPKYNVPTKRGKSSNYGRNRLMEILVRHEQWETLIELANSPYLSPIDSQDDTIKRLHAKAVAHAHLAQFDHVEKITAELKNIQTTATKERDQTIEKAVTKAKEAVAKKKEEQKDAPASGQKRKATSKNPITKAKEDAAKKFKGRLDTLKSAITELEIYTALYNKKRRAARRLLSDIDELNASRHARLLQQLGKEKEAIEIAKEHVKDHPNEIEPLALLTWLQLDDRKFKEAEATFVKLRKIAAHVDMDLPSIKRLRPLADRLHLDDDWRQELPKRKDVGARPPLDTLGPIHWRSTPAPDWALETKDGKTLSLSNYKGKPVVMIFYLGHGCSHCLEQLNAFSPKTAEFNKLGIELVGISTDSVEGLRKTFDGAFLKKDFPFPLASDQKLEVFKRYRCHDDFESMPLHGTFLIDGNGEIRWMDISFEPFTEADFLIKEAERLLSPSHTPGAIATK